MSSGRSRPGKSRGGPWYGEFRERLAFERGAKQAYPTLKSSAGRGGGYIATVQVDVPGFEPRTLRIAFDRDHVRTPRVFVDGPTGSKHRYADSSLCMWYPRDPEEGRWLQSDGLLALIGCAILHLLREGWWRETGHWFGPEYPHESRESKPAPEREERDGRRDAH